MAVHDNFVTWLLSHVPDLEQSIYDPSLLSSRNQNMAVLLTTDDTLVVMPKSKLHLEDTASQRLQCMSRAQLPTDFKELDVGMRQGSIIFTSQKKDLNNLASDSNNVPKKDLFRSATEEELNAHRKVAGKPA